MEDQSLLIQNFDSLWFFSNVVNSSSTAKPTVQSFKEKTAEEEDTQKPIKKPITQNEPPNAEFVAETESESSVSVLGVAVEEAEHPNAAKKEEKSRRKKTIRRIRRKIVGEVDLGVDWRLNYEVEERWNGLGMYRSKQHLVKMPPLSDGMAMKQHLKSWAYAVACTVR